MKDKKVLDNILDNVSRCVLDFGQWDLRVLLCDVTTTGDYMQETLTVELTSKLRTLLDRTKDDMLLACENGLQVALTRNDEQRVKYWREEFKEINNLQYEELFRLFIDTQYRRMR